MKFDFPIECVVKELEGLHEVILSEQTTPLKRNELIAQVQDTLQRLNGSILCNCHDHRCIYYRNQMCLCRANLKCREIGFTFNLPRSNFSDEQLAVFKDAVTTEEASRKPNEPFIVWKVRVTAKVDETAYYVWNYKDVGTTRYGYPSWRDTTESAGETNFKAYMAQLRHDPVMAKSVGCFACSVVFQTQENLEAHVDRLRFLHDTEHTTTAKMVTPDSVTSVRPSPPTYHYPIPPPTVRPRPFAGGFSGPTSIDRFPRDAHDTPTTYRTTFADYMRDNIIATYPSALGCYECGKIFPQSEMVNDHLMRAHGYESPISDDLVVYPSPELDWMQDEAAEDYNPERDGPNR